MLLSVLQGNFLLNFRPFDALYAIGIGLCGSHIDILLTDHLGQSIFLELISNRTNGPGQLKRNARLPQLLDQGLQLLGRGVIQIIHGFGI